jgi:hypothetical protein
MFKILLIFTISSSRGSYLYSLVKGKGEGSARKKEEGRRLVEPSIKAVI